MTEQPHKQKSSRSFAGIAGIVAAATLISKIFGLIRQQAIAAAFGVGAAATAHCLPLTAFLLAAVAATTQYIKAT